MSKKTTKATAETQRPGYVTTFREGAVGATVWLKERAEGMLSLTFSLSRSFQSKSSGKTGYSTEYADYNVEALHSVTSQAGDFIRKHKDNPEAAIAAGQELNDIKKQSAQQREPDVSAAA